MVRLRVSPQALEVLNDILVCGCVQRRWRNPQNLADYSWYVNGVPRTHAVHSLYRAGCLEPDRGNPHVMVVSAHGRARLAELARQSVA